MRCRTASLMVSMQDISSGVLPVRPPGTSRFSQSVLKASFMRLFDSTCVSRELPQELMFEQ
jgi:hypothetical protein